MSTHAFEDNAMSIMSSISRIALLLSLSCAVTSALAATAQRRFVAHDGNDANDCSLAAPCRNFSAAILQTDPNGEVIVLDSAGYGPVVITQPVSIIAPAGVYAGISVFTGAGVTVNAGGGVVTLRGLTINSLGGNIGVDYVAGSRLYLDRVTVTGFSLAPASAGVRANLSTSGILQVRGGALRENSKGLTASASSGTLTVDIENSVFERNTTGLELREGTAGVIQGSQFTDSTTGIAAAPTTAAKTSTIEVWKALVADNVTGVQSGVNAGAPTFVSLISSLVTGNTTGVQATANPVYCSDNTITRNTAGLSLVTGGTGQTAQDNAVANNTGSAAFTSVVPKL
jgi:hypothetical protein